MIFTGFYYNQSIKNGDLIVRDNRFYPGKYIETFPVWYQYIRKNYPDEHIVFLNDSFSKYQIFDFLSYFDSYEIIEGYKFNKNIKNHIKNLTTHQNKYFWSMQRNLVEALTFSHKNNEDFFWVDNDCFLNSNIFQFLENNDVLAPTISDEQMTCDTVCMYISRRKIKSFDEICNFPAFLKYALDTAPEKVRMHLFQEGGFYKLFCNGKYKEFNKLNISHLSCYENFIKFLHRNKLDSFEYEGLIRLLNEIDMSRLAGVEMKFWDMYHEA